MEENEFVRQTFDAARKAGLCYNWSEFGELLGIDRSAMSKTRRNGFSERMVLKVEKILAEHGVVINGNNTGIVQSGDNPTATQAPQAEQPQPPLSDKILAEMQAQREMYDRQFSELLRQNSQLIAIITNSLP